MSKFCITLFTMVLLGDSLIAGGLSLDFSKTNGVLRPLHGANLGPLCYKGMVDLSSYHRELNIPLTRLHDVVWVNYDAVDISSIFRDFRNDPAKPDNYEFAATDDYIQAIVNSGSPILYRLGESIEHTPRKYRVHPPRDFYKWAAICCQIIEHYNQGWANGFHHGIRYWEIWNEPENQPAMWTGSDDQYFRLYETTAKAIKTRWPDLKIGGPSIGYSGEFDGEQFKPGAFLLRFLAFCRERQVPVDFFSWHRYAKDPSEFARRAKAIRKLLDEHGFPHAESHLNEWNYLPNEDWKPVSREGQGILREQCAEEMGGPKGAAFAAWSLMSLQDAPLDMANFYTAEIQLFGMFNFNGVPRKTFYAFKAFRSLLDTRVRIATPPCQTGQIALCAGINDAGTQAAVLVSNFDSEVQCSEIIIKNLPWASSTRYQTFVVDKSHDFQLVQEGMAGASGQVPLTDLKPASVVYIKFTPWNSGPAR